MKEFHVGQTVMRVEESYDANYGVKGQKYILTFANKARLNGYSVGTGEKIAGADPSAFVFVVDDTLKVEDFV